jgi:hypothetical protein
VEKGPSVMERLFGGLPLSLPEDMPPLLGHAEETAGPCRRRTRVLGVTADRGSFASLQRLVRFVGVTADWG